MMETATYFRQMTALGYPEPDLHLWVDANGDIKGAASYRGTCGHGGPSGVRYNNWPDLIAALFKAVTNGGKRYEAE